jgi:EF hand domain-containing protein
MLHKRKLITIAIGTAFLMSFGAAPVLAHECKHCEHMMSKMDADEDGKISRTEYMRHHGEMFDKHDSNGDRFLDADELHSKMEHMHGHKHDHGDDDHDHGHGHGHDDSDDDDHGHGH